jgi:hypothetical protein
LLSLLGLLEALIIDGKTFSHYRCDLAFLSDMDERLSHIRRKLKGKTPVCTGISEEVIITSSEF